MQLLEKLYTVTNIYSLGDHLKVPTHILEEIKLDCHNTEERRRALFIHWMDNAPEKNRTWETIVYALSKSSNTCLAKKVALEFGGPTIPYSHNTAQNIIIHYVMTGVPPPCVPHETKDKVTAPVEQVINILFLLCNNISILLYPSLSQRYNHLQWLQPPRPIPALSLNRYNTCVHV